MEDESFSPEENEEIELDKTLILNADDLIISGFKFSEEEDKKILEKIFGKDFINEKEIEKENKNISKLEEPKNASLLKKNKIKNKNKVQIKIIEMDKFKKKMELFFIRAYDIISENNYDKLTEEEENKEYSDKLLNIINQILLEKKNNNCEIEIIFGNKDKIFNDKDFIINIYVGHKISKFNGLLEIDIVFKVKIEMSIRSGNVKLYIPKFSIEYGNSKQKIIMNPNFGCLLINNYLGNYGITYCNCGDCVRCKNRKEKKSFPFDDLLNYLKKSNEIPNKIEFTGLYYGKINKYRNESGYKCSFCKEFYEKKLNIVKLFCNPDFDPEHTCEFWICKDCYYNKLAGRGNEICPNCRKFYINLFRLSRIYRYYKWRKYH